MANYTVWGEVYRFGNPTSPPLAQYATFRYHSGGIAGMTLSSVKGVETMWYPPTGDLSSAGMNFGLRRPDGVQQTSVQFASGQRGRRNFSGYPPAGNYAINARLRVDSQGNPQNTLLRFDGTLHLDGGYPN